jgi:hypothetical protein
MTTGVVTYGIELPKSLLDALSLSNIISFGTTTPVIVWPADAVRMGIAAGAGVVTPNARVALQEQYSEHRMLVEQLEIVATPKVPPGHDPWQVLRLLHAVVIA